MSNETKTHGTNVHVIDGKTFVEVERKAEVGELVVYNFEGVTQSTPRKVTKVNDDTVSFSGYYDEDEGDYVYGYAHPAYRVLAEVGEKSAPTSTEDIIANLVRRVHSLEIQLRDTQNNVERQGVEIANLEAADTFEALVKYERSVGR